MFNFAPYCTGTSHIVTIKPGKIKGKNMNGTDYTTLYEIDGQDSLQVFETVPDLYLILSPDLRVLTASNLYLEAISTSRAEVHEMLLEDLFHRYGIESEDGLNVLKATLDAVASSGKGQSMPVHNFRLLKRAAAGQVGGYWQVSNSPVLDSSQKLLYIIHKLNDITEIIQKEKSYQAALDEDLKKFAASAELFRKAESAGNTGSYQLDLETHEIRFSDGMYNLLGYNPHAFVPTMKFLDSISHPEDVEMVNQAIQNAIVKKQPYDYIRRIYTPEGKLKCIHSKGKVIEDESGKPLHILGVSNDITEKIKADEDLAKAHAELSKNKDLLQSVFDTTVIAMSVLRPVRNSEGAILDFEITLVSREMEHQTNRTDLIGCHYVQEFPGVKMVGLFDLMLKVMETGVTETLEFYYPYEGYNKWYSCSFVKMGDGLVSSNLDITPIREAEEKLREMEELQRLEVFKATISTQEEERNRIAEDLRNGIGQLLYAVKINLKHLDLHLATTDAKSFQDAKSRTDQILAEAIKEIRRLSHLMTPATLEHFGLEESIKDLCRQYSPDLHIKVSVTGLKGRLDRYMEVSLYRMAQELLQNTVTHAKATSASVQIKKEKQSMILTVMDNGRGFLPEEVKTKGLGLASLFNRVRLLNGRVDVVNTRGTKVTIKIPLNKAP